MPFSSFAEKGYRLNSRFKNAATRVFHFLFPPRLEDRKTAGSFEPSTSVLLTQEPTRAQADARRVMRETLGLRPADWVGEWTVMEKGISPRRLALPLLAGLFTFTLGALITVLFAFEGTVTLKAGSRAVVPEEDRGVIRPFRSGESSLGILFEESGAEYAEVPGEEAFKAVEVRAKLKFMRDGSVIEALAGTGEAVRYGGYSFRLLKIEQTLRLRIDGSPIPINARPGGEALIPGSLSTLVFGDLVKGAVTRIDGSRQELRPHVTIKKKGVAGEPAVLRPGEPVIVDGAMVALADARETAVLRYRYDPGSRFLLAGGLITALTAMLWFFRPYYFLAYRIDGSGEIARLDLFVFSGGAFASKERLTERIVRLLTEDDLRPEALAD